MALQTVSSGGTIQATDVNQFHDVLTGGMTDQAVTLGSSLDVKGAAVLESALSVTGAATLGGGVSGALAATGAVSGTTGTFSGAVKSNGNPVAEGTTTATHIEALFDGSSSGSLASGSYITKTLTCTRSFSGNAVAVGASCQTSAGNKGAISYGVTGYGYDGGGHINAVTVAFQNTDPNPQTLSNFSILAIGV